MKYLLLEMDKTCKFPKNILNRLKIWKSLFHINSQRKKSLGKRSLVFILISNVRHSCTIYFLYCQCTQCTIFSFGNFQLVQIFLDEIIIQEAIEDGICTGGWDSNHMADKEADHHCLWNCTKNQLHNQIDSTNKTCALKHI